MNSIKIARELIRLAKVITAKSAVAEAIDDIVAGFGYRINRRFNNDTDFFVLFPIGDNCDSKGLEDYFDWRKKRMVTGKDGVEYGPFRTVPVPTRTGCHIGITSDY